MRMFTRILPEVRRELTGGWSLREADPALSPEANFGATEGWLDATVPGTVYQDLLRAGRIPDPWVGRDEERVQWVAESDWCYRLVFEIDAGERRPQTALEFDGLDTFARAWLNGAPLFHSDNMFVPRRIQVGARLRAGRNELWLRFDSALRRGRELEQHHGRRALWNGDSSRLYVRKAPFHYGWDWGPTLLTAGPWRPVRLHASEAHLGEIASPVWLASDGTWARVDVRTTVEGMPPVGTAADGVDMLMLRQCLLDPEGRCVATAEDPASAQTIQSLNVPAARLWWPNGHGAQPLYTLHTELLHDGLPVSQRQRRLGVRSLRLLQQPVAGEAGRSFHLEVNGREIFCGGANWIPDDSLLNRITPARYRERVAQAAAAHMTMLRVWGGGIYEDEAFYDACDELGVLVWQDFVFACGLYPANAPFLASVEAEARAAVRRLRHRASLALWCGNNEDYMLAESVGAYGPGKDLARFDGRRIYEDLLPAICAELDPGRPYWPGSPFSSTSEGPWSPQDQTVGDRHSWEVWHQAMLPYDQYAKFGARFVSEFGLQSHPSLAVLEATIPEDERFPGSRTMQSHNKASSVVGADGHRRLAAYVADNLRAAHTLRAEVYATQFVQAEAVRHAFEAFRGRWQRPGARACGGALVWQLNDCWPATSWALVDCTAHQKPAWYAARRALAPLACALRREPTGLRAWVMRAGQQTLALRARWRLWALDSRLLHDEVTEAPTPVDGSQPLEPPAALRTVPEGAVTTLHLEAADGATASAFAWPEPFRWYRLPDPQLQLHAEGASALLVSARGLAKGVWIDAGAARLGDNFLDLLPGESRQLACDQPAGGLSAQCLNTLQDPPDPA
jgi:beta-mannosidase